MLPFRSSIATVLSNAPDRPSVETVVAHCHNVALSYLRMKRRSGALPGYLQVHALKDLAIDCIADLFERDAAGHFTVLRRYFERHHWQRQSDERLQSLTRRLVFSQVNAHLFEVHRRHDPILGKIIRSVKRAVRKHPGAYLERRGGALWCCAPADEQAEHDPRPQMPPEVLEQYLRASLGSGTNLRAVMDVTFALWEQQTLYERAYPVSQVALAVRSLIGHRYQAEEVARAFTPPEEQPTLPEPLVRRGIDEAVATTHTQLRPTYVSDHFDAHTYDRMLKAVRTILCGQYVTHSTAIRSHHGAYCAWVQPVSYEEYRTQHRGVLEYMVRVARKEMVERLRQVV